MNLVSLLIAPAIVSLSIGNDSNAAIRIIISLAAIAIIVVAVVLSKRRSIGIAESDTAPAAPPAAHV
jgi:K(+)-stimulated pyrophosphate-energized sodium pump